MLIGVDPSTGTLIELARTGVTFILDAGVSGTVDTPIGKGTHRTGSGTDSKSLSSTDYSIAKRHRPAVATVAGLSTNSSGVLASVTHASIVAGTQYHLALKTAGGGIGITGPITAA